MFWEPDGLMSFTAEADATPWNCPRWRSPATLRLAATDPGTANLDATPGRPPVTVASLRLPAALVDARRTELAARARVLGSHHSLRIWRDAHREALIALAREASGIPTGVECAALFWTRDGDLYRVSATFASSRATVH